MCTNNIISKLIFLVIFFLFFTQYSYSQSDKIKNALTDTRIQIQGKLQEEKGTFRYDYYGIYN